MFSDSFLANFVVFVLGQLAAWGYLRTGRVRRGVVLMVATWVLADAALLARFAYDDAAVVYTTALLGMQVWSLVEFGLFCFGRWRRRRPAVLRARGELFREALACTMRDELPQAEALHRRLLRTDPWDVDVQVALGCGLARQGQTSRARSALRSARALDRDERYADLVTEELALLSRS